MSSFQWTSEPRVFPTAGSSALDTSLQIEEDTFPTYQPEKYHPTQIGEVPNSTYQVLAKLGYGVTSTVWFGRDLVESKYVALKIFVKDRERNHELDVIIGLTRWSPHRQHICLVHEPLGISASELMKWIPGRAMSLEDLKPCIRHLLVVLDFLYSIAHVIHTDIQLRNLLLTTPMPKALSDFEEREVKAQLARKVLQDRTIYTSARFPLETDYLF
ncbi:hypothetical protein RU639_012736 [Aspergillus parasiticus]